MASRRRTVLRSQTVKWTDSGLPQVPGMTAHGIWKARISLPRDQRLPSTRGAFEAEVGSFRRSAKNTRRDWLDIDQRIQKAAEGVAKKQEQKFSKVSGDFPLLAVVKVHKFTGL